MEQMRQINVGGLRVEKSWALPPSSSVSPGEALSLLSKLHVPQGTGAFSELLAAVCLPSSLFEQGLGGLLFFFFIF